MDHVPFRGAAPLVQELIAGRVQFGGDQCRHRWGMCGRARSRRSRMSPRANRRCCRTCRRCASRGCRRSSSMAGTVSSRRRARPRRCWRGCSARSLPPRANRMWCGVARNWRGAGRLGCRELRRHGARAIGQDPRPGGQREPAAGLAAPRVILFVYGTLLDAGVLTRVSGERALAQRLVPARLDGWRRVFLRGTPYPTLVPAAGASVNGAVLRVGAAPVPGSPAWRADAGRP